jgi:hypothetical protein
VVPTNIHFQFALSSLWFCSTAFGNVGMTIGTNVRGVDPGIFYHDVAFFIFRPCTERLSRLPPLTLRNLITQHSGS